MLKISAVPRFGERERGNSGHAEKRDLPAAMNI